MKIILDTNIIIRLLIKPDGIVAGLFYAVCNKHELYVSDFSFEEIAKHRSRLLKASKLNARDFDRIYESIISNLSIVPMEIIPNSIFLRSFQYTSSVDLDDIPFVATTLFLEGFLWTSDKKLYDALKQKGLFGLLLNNKEIKDLIK